MTTNLFVEQPSFQLLLYFLYGFIFIYLGVAIATKDMRESRLVLAECLWLLAGFGLMHGLHEWLELYCLLIPAPIFSQDMCVPSAFRIVVLLSSFLFLSAFGLWLSVPSPVWRYSICSAILVLLAVLLAVTWGSDTDLFWERAEYYGRIFLGGGGGLLTAYGLIAHSNTLKSFNQPVARKFFWAGIMVAVYAFHAGPIPSHTILPPFSLPVEVVRGLSAGFISYFIVKGLNIFDLETRRKVGRQMEIMAQSEKLSSLGRFAAGVAHEINNPLANASLNLEIITRKLEGRDDIDQAVRLKLAAAERNIDRAAKIAQEMLRFARVETESFSLVNLGDTIDRALVAVKFMVGKVLLHKSYNHTSKIMGNADQLVQVVINVLDNALGVMPDGGDLAISTHEEKDKIILSVIDSGSGIDGENISRVFDPFFTTKEVGRGTGLGLAICYGIMQQHGGDINIENRKGAGAHVTLTFPVDMGERHD